MTLLIVEPNDEGIDMHINLEVRGHSIDIPMSVDEMYNLIVCKDCGIGVPFEWVPSHLNDYHGIKVTREQVLAFLGLEDDGMTVAQAED